jgi:hypothetical protein
MTPCDGARFRLSPATAWAFSTNGRVRKRRFHEAFLSVPVLLWRVRAADDSCEPPNGQACVEFPAPDFIEAMVTQVGRVIPAGGARRYDRRGSVSRRQRTIQRAAGVSWAARIKAQELFRCPTALIPSYSGRRALRSATGCSSKSRGACDGDLCACRSIASAERS